MSHFFNTFYKTPKIFWTTSDKAAKMMVISKVITYLEVVSYGT